MLLVITGSTINHKCYLCWQRESISC
jgi:hypothetical protein